MKGMQTAFLTSFHLPAVRAGEAFSINPAMILAQAAIESGWGGSVLAARYHNFFGLTAYGRKNDYWDGDAVMLGGGNLLFRVYADASSGFLDYARLIREAYPAAADMSYRPAAFAREIAYCKCLSEVDGDNRETYRHSVVSLCESISKFQISDWKIPDSGFQIPDSRLEDWKIARLED